MDPMASPTPPELTSAANPRVKAARALRDRRERDRAGLTLIDGARELRRALDAGVTIDEAFVCEPLLAGQDARAALDGLFRTSVPVHRVSERVTLDLTVVVAVDLDAMPLLQGTFRHGLLEADRSTPAGTADKG